MARCRNIPPTAKRESGESKRARLSKKTTIEYISAEKVVTTGTNVLDKVNKGGITCTWIGRTNGVAVDSSDTSDSDEEPSSYTVNFNWNFDWEKLKAQGVESLSGYLIVKTRTPGDYIPKKVDIDWKQGKEAVFMKLPSDFQSVRATFEYHFTAHYSVIEQVPYEEMFAASDKTDVVLVVEGKKLHVNKTFLSFHSDFFTALFSSNFKEGQQAEIPIQDVSYEDFGLLLSIIYPQQVFPNDKTAEKLLELADRFLMPAVTRQVERHLLENSELSIEKLLFIADAYRVPRVLERAISVMDTLNEIKALEKFPEYAKLSKEAKSSLFDRVMQII